MLTIRDINLNKNPFEEITPIPGEPAVWAGMAQVKEKITAFYQELTTTDAKKIVLNWGPMGGGKTFAANYFKINPPIGSDSFKVTSIVCNIPREGKDSSKAFLMRIIDALTIDNIRIEFENAKKEMGKDGFKEHLLKRTQSEIFTDTILRLFDIQSDEIIRRYIHSGLSTNDLKKTHLSKSLKTDDDFFNFTTGLLVALTAATNRRVVLWIDEMENMLYYQNKLYRTVGALLRELSDKIAQRFLMFMNFTLTESDEDTIKYSLGEALWTRINTRVRFNELTESEAKVYIEDLIKNNQIDNSTLKPFSDVTLESLVKSIPSSHLIPREINKRGDQVVQYALKNDILEISSSDVALAVEASREE